MKPLVCFQPISPIPVTTTFDEGLGAFDILLDEQFVVEEDAYADNSQNDVDARTEDAGLFEQGLVGSESFVLVADNYKPAVTLSIASRIQVLRGGCTLSPILAKISARLPFAASTSVSPAFSVASSSSFLKPSSSLSLSTLNRSYSASSHGNVASILLLRLPRILADGGGFRELVMEGLRAEPSPEVLRVPSIGWAR